MSHSITAEILTQIDQLPDDQQRKVLDFVHSLKVKGVVGVPGATLLRFAGLIPVDELERMEQAIAEGCERVDVDAW